MPLGVESLPKSGRHVLTRLESSPPVNEGCILVVDNEPQIRRVMRTTLIPEGFEVDDAKSGDEALEHIRSGKYDLVLLDINMPGMSGFDTCRAIRDLSDMPIIMLTVHDAEKDKVEALDAGADDYITKPFGMPELLARVRAVLRRRSPILGLSHIHLGQMDIDFETRQVRGPHGQVHLTAKEFDLLSYLASHPNKVIGHRELLRAVWGPEYGDETEYLRVFVNRLRKKIEQKPTSPKHLLTEPWVGYRLRLPE
jgi:two-component system, OmpR family, KDP operon response regulator KdpE